MNKKRPLGKPRHIWDDNIKIKVKYVGRMIDLVRAWDQWRAVVNTVMNLEVQ
jgi:hypothetical protein